MKGYLDYYNCVNGSSTKILLYGEAEIKEVEEVTGDGIFEQTNRKNVEVEIEFGSLTEKRMRVKIGNLVFETEKFAIFEEKENDTNQA